MIELTNLRATHVSYVTKGANKKKFFLMKSDNVTPVFQRDFRIIKGDDEKQIVYGVVYEPDEVDTQGEFANADEIEKAAHQFLSDSRNVDLQHNFVPGAGTVVESYVAPVDFEIEGQNIKKGAWVMATIADDEVWESIKKGEITGYSMAGTATKTTVAKNEAPDDETKGLFNVLKDFFTGKVEKAASKASFANRMAVHDAMDDMWKVNDTLQSCMRDILDDDTVKDKKTAMENAIDEYSAYMKKRVSNIDDGKVKKSDSDFFSKSGRSLSAANRKRLKDAHTALTELLELTNKEKEGDEVKKEDVQAIVKAAINEALKPLNEALARFEKQEDTKHPATEEGDITAVIKAAVEEAIKPVSERISTIEKARGMSAQQQEQPQQTVQKSIFAGLPF